MTEKEANSILKKKYPEGYIRYQDLGRKSNTNRIVVVCFTQHGKDYQYKGGFESVLIKLGCLEPVKYETIYTSDYNPATDNIFINALRNNNN